MKTKAARRSRPLDNQAIAPLNQPNQIMFPKLSKPRAALLAAFRFGVGMEEYCEDLARSVINALPRKKPVIVRVDEPPRQAQGDGRVRRLRGAGGPRRR